ncbi:MAG TPA: cell envelope integrity protein CreD [Bacteroidota bacterium]|nr:cell envelope integrity protein CreD [Bacteroidota bacterium]
MSDTLIKRSVLLRMFLIGGLTVALLIPSLLIIGLVDERETTRDSAVSEVSDKWGNAQTIAGPILTVVYRVPSYTTKERIVYTTGLAHFLPESLVVSATIQPEVRHRGMYEVVLYSSRIQFRGTFAAPAFAQLGIPAEDILWDKAFLTLGISDLKGVKEGISIQFDDQTLVADPGVNADEVLTTGINVHPKVSPSAKAYAFSASLDLNGSGQLMFVPVGKETRVTVASPWGNPSFIGNTLPVRRVVSEGTFAADWKVLHLNRNFPQQWAGKQFDISQASFGVKLLLPVDEYQKTTRAAKYAIMFIVFTFLAFFLTEILNKKVIHPIQYALIGFALLLFYVLLLSISEQMAFNYAYVISSAGIILLVGGYTRSVLTSNVAALAIAGIMILLYGFMYVLLQLEDYALLLGSVGLFLILALVMYLTRRIDWFAIGAKQEGV